MGWRKIQPPGFICWASSNVRDSSLPASSSRCWCFSGYKGILGIGSPKELLEEIMNIRRQNLRILNLEVTRVVSLWNVIRPKHRYESYKGQALNNVILNMS